MYNPLKSIIYPENKSAEPLILHLILLKQPNMRPPTGKTYPTVHFLCFENVNLKAGPSQQKGKKGQGNVGNDFVQQLPTSSVW